MANKPLPCFNSSPVKQRRANIGGEQACASPRHRPVNDIKQTARAAAACRAGQLQAFTRGGINHHMILHRAAHRRLEEGEGALPRMIKIGEETACR